MVFIFRYNYPHKYLKFQAFKKYIPLSNMVGKFLLPTSQFLLFSNRGKVNISNFIDLLGELNEILYVKALILGQLSNSNSLV